MILSAVRCHGTRFAAGRSTQLASRRVAFLKPAPTQMIVTRAFGGGFVGPQKVVMIFSFLGGLAIFTGLASQVIKNNIFYSLFLTIFLTAYLLLGETNMNRHMVAGTKAFQDLHIWFTLAFIPVCYVFY